MFGAGESLQDRFGFWQFVLAALHILSGLLVAIYIAATDRDKNPSWPVDVAARYTVWAAPGAETEDGAGSCGETDAGCRIFTIETEPTKFELGYTAACFSLISGFHHLLVGIAIKNKETTLGKIYSWCLTKSVFPIRWLDYAVTSGLMFAVVTALFESPISLDVVVLTFCFQFLVIVAGAASEYIWSLETTTTKKSQTRVNGWELIWKPLRPETEKNFIYNAFLYTVIGSTIGVVSAIMNDVLAFFSGLFKQKKLERSSNSKSIAGILNITRNQIVTIMYTAYGLVFLCTAVPYVIVFCVIFYKFYLGTNAGDEDHLVSTLGSPVPQGVKTPPDGVWVAIISIFITFSSFAVCHVNKISLTVSSQIRDTIKYETIYGFLSFSSKIILLYNIFAGIVMRGRSDTQPITGDFNPASFETQEPKRSEEDEGLSAAIVSLLITVPVSLLFGIWSYYDILVAKTRKEQFSVPIAAAQANKQTKPQTTTLYF